WPACRARWGWTSAGAPPRRRRSASRPRSSRCTGAAAASASRAPPDRCTTTDAGGARPQQQSGGGSGRVSLAELGADRQDRRQYRGPQGTRRAEVGMTRISVNVDGTSYTDEVEPRTLLVQYLRDRL